MPSPCTNGPHLVSKEEHRFTPSYYLLSSRLRGDKSARSRFTPSYFLLRRRFAAPTKNRRPLVQGSDRLYACGFRIYFTPLPGFFSPFPHGTGSLSVDYEYLALEDGPPIFRQDFTCPALLVASLVPHHRFRVRGYHPL